MPESSRQPILASVVLRGTGDGRGWLAMAATILAGLAVIAFIGDNWAAIPRGMKLLLLMTLFLSAAIGSAFTQPRSEKISNGLALLSVLIFSGSIALLGQAYNMPGAPSGAVFASAFAAALIGLAGRSAAASFAALVFGWIWLGMSLEDQALSWINGGFWGLNLIVGIVALAAWLKRSRALWHGLIISAMLLLTVHVLEISSLLTGNGLEYWETRFDNDGRVLSFIAFALLAVIWTGLSWIGVSRDVKGKPGGRTLAGYGGWLALGNIALLSFPMADDATIIHRFIWLAASSYALWYGAKHSYGWISAAAIVSLLTAVSVIFVDLGLALSAAALIFGVTAAVTLLVVLFLRADAKKKAGALPHA